MKKIVMWTLGDRGGRVAIATWHWLWAKPIESGGNIAVEVAQESLHAMQQSVYQLTESVAKITASYQKAKQKLESKEKEFHEAERQARLAHQNHMEDAARLAMSKAISIEKLLPQLVAQVTQAEQILKDNQEQLRRSRQELETYKVEMQNIKDITEMNEALATINQLNNTLDKGSTRSQFEQVQAAVMDRSLRVNAVASLSYDSDCQVTSNLKKLVEDDEVSKRLNQFTINPE
jgi:phage shock protein A